MQQQDVHENRHAMFFANLQNIKLIKTNNYIKT